MKRYLSKKADTILAAMVLLSCLLLFTSNILRNVDDAQNGESPVIWLTVAWGVAALAQLGLFFMHLSALRTYRRFVDETEGPRDLADESAASRREEPNVQ